MDPDRGFFPPAYANPAARVGDLLRLNEVVMDQALQALFIGDGVTAGGKPLGAWPGALSPGLQFEVVGTILSSAPTTPVQLLADAVIPAGKQVYINYIFVTVNGATAWTTAYNVVIQDSAAVAAVTLATAQLAGNAVISTMSQAGVTPGAPVLAQSGLTAGKGIQIVGSSASIVAGSPLIALVGGYIK
jgi:hypothetical protein